MAEGGQGSPEDLKTWGRTSVIEQRLPTIGSLSPDILDKGRCAVHNITGGSEGQEESAVLGVKQEPGTQAPVDRSFRETQEPPNDDDVEALSKHFERLRLPVVRIYCETRTGCITCKSVSKRSMFTSYKEEKEYPLQNGFSCHTQNAVYLISCENAECMKERKRRQADEGQAQEHVANFEFRYQYVGQTKQTIVDRMSKHRSAETGPIRKHCEAAKHDVSDMKWTVIEVINSKEDRKRRETYWIHELGADLNTEKTKTSLSCK